VPISKTAYSPETLDVSIGIYHLDSGQRMHLTDGSDMLALGQVDLLANRGDNDVPNPIAVNFSNELELIGYAMDERLLAPGDTITFTLYWRVTTHLTKNYTGSIQVLDTGFNKYGQWDAWLVDGETQTTGWQPGKIVQNYWQVPLSADTPPGSYNVQLIIYWTDETGDMHRLQRLTSDGNLTDDFLPLTRIRVE
jgi:hypothetical protein